MSGRVDLPAPLHTIYPAANPGGTQKGLELVKREGGRHVFDHTNADSREQILKATGGRGVDLILEMLANVNLGHDLKLLAPQGRVVVIGGADTGCDAGESPYSTSEPGLGRTRANGAFCA